MSDSVTTHDSVQDTLSGALERAGRGGTHIVVVHGSAGAGQSEMLEAFAHMAARGGRRPRPRVLLLQPTPTEAYRPLTHAALASRPSLYRRFGGERQARNVARSLAVEWLGAIPGYGDLIGAIGATAEALSRRRYTHGLPQLAVTENVAAALWVAARRRTLVLCIDAAERMSAAELRLLVPLLNEAPANVRLLVVAACDTTRLPADSPLSADAGYLPGARHVELPAPADAPLAGMARIDVRTHHVLRRAATIPEPFAAVDLAHLLDADQLEVEDRLAIAERARLVTWAGDSQSPPSSTFRMASPLVREHITRHHDPATGAGA